MERIKQYNIQHCSVTSSIILAILPILCILLCHSIGYFIIESLPKFDHVLGWRTSLTGYIFIGLILTIGSLIYGGLSFIRDKFSDFEFGVSVMNDAK